MARTRTFIGVDVGAEVRRAAGDVQASLARSGASVKWSAEANLHVTLLFLGDVDDRELMNVCRVVSRAAATEPPFAAPRSHVAIAVRKRLIWSEYSELSVKPKFSVTGLRYENW